MPNFLTAAEMNTLKAKVKTEMQRRAYNGSMTGFASASYDFSTTPTSGTKVTADQGKKVVEPLLNIKDHGNLNTADLKTGSKIPSSFNNELLSYTDSLSQEPIDGATSSCRGACSGLCVGTCGSTCSGCSSCSGGCSGSGGSGGSGSSGCGGCSGNCGGGCSECSSCSGTCTIGCSGCIGSCDGCSNGCGGCNGCSGSCQSCSGCAGCGGSCSSSCSASGKGSSCATCYSCTGCASSCSSCSSCGGCSGCSGCGSTCSSCDGACSGSCSLFCSGCSGCSASCESSCTTGCQGCSGCSGGCSGCSGCGSGCYGSCTGNCDGCSNGCSGQCKNACATNCSATCTGTCQAQAFGAVVSGGEDPTVDLIANGEWTYAVDTDLVTAKSVSVTRKGTEYNFNIDGLTILNQKTNLGDIAITFINEHDSLLDPSKMSANEPTIKIDSKNYWYLVPVYPTYRLKINKGKPLMTFANTYYSELHFNIKA